MVVLIVAPDSDLTVRLTLSVRIVVEVRGRLAVRLPRVTCLGLGICWDVQSSSSDESSASPGGPSLSLLVRSLPLSYGGYHFTFISPSHR